MSLPQTMRAVHLLAPGSPSALQLVNLPVPTPKPGQVLLRVKAFGINYSEALTRRFGRAPVGPVSLPRVLGVEAVGLVAAAPGKEFQEDDIVLTALGGMGIMFDGGYAEYTLVSAANVRSLGQTTKLDWQTIGAIPVMVQTAWGTLFRSLKLSKDDTLLIRGGTSSIGLAAIAIAHNHGAKVFATTRKIDEKTRALLQSAGAQVISGEDVKSQVEAATGKVDKILDFVGGSTIPESMSLLKTNGICCSVGLVGGSPTVEGFSPIAAIPTGTYLTGYGERTFQPSNFPLEEIVQDIETGKLKLRIAKTFKLDEIVQAHELLESNQANGKIVILVD